MSHACVRPVHPCEDPDEASTLSLLALVRSESWNTFRYVTEQTNWAWGVREAARVSGAVLMWQVGKKMPAKYGISGDLREVLYK